MKKIISLLLCLAMLGSAVAFAEEAAAKELGVVGNARVGYSVSCEAPKQFTVFQSQADNQTIEGMLANENPKQASYVFSVALEEEYADVESLVALDDAAMEAWIAPYQEDGLTVTVKEKNGEKYLCLAEAGAKKNTFVSIETVMNGCLVQISLSPVEEVISAMTEKQAEAAIDFLSTLAFAPADPIPGEETEEEELLEQAEPEQEEEAAAVESQPMLVGGWTVSGDPVNVRLSEEEQKVFDQAVALTGMDYEPVIVLATQVVAGTNFAYLCREKGEDQEWIVVTIYSGLNGDVQVLNAHVLALYHLLTTDKALPANLAGGWTLRQPDNGAILLDEAAQAAFSQAVAAADESLDPIAVLGTQVVSGINYKVLAQGEAALYLVDVYAPFTGDASITDMQMLDLLSYVSVN